MLKILVAVDAHTPLEGTIRHLKTLNKPMEVTLIHVIDSIYYMNVQAEGRHIVTPATEVERHALQWLEEVRDRFPTDLTVSLVLLEGSALLSVAHHINMHDYDLVIMGSRRFRQPVRKALLGSVTGYTITHVDVPVLVFTEDRREDDMRYILIPIDGSLTSKRAVEKGVEVQKLTGGQVTLLYVCPDVRREGLVEGVSAMERNMSFMIERGEDALAEAKEFFGPEVAVDTILEKGVVTKCIEEMVKNGPYDLVIMGTEGMGSALKRLLLGSVTKHVLEHVKVPVLVVR